MEKPNYYSIIPAEVRYDKNLTPNAKLLYGEITALTNKEGYCWASNNYFAELYNVSKTSISAWVSQLKEKGYIDIELIYQGKEIKQRKITLYKKSLIPIQENLNTPIQENFKENNTSINNTLNIYKGMSKKVEEVFKEYVEHRKKLKAPMTDLAIAKAISKLNQMYDNEKDQIECIEQSIINGWKGLFEIKKTTHTKEVSMAKRGSLGNISDLYD